MNRRAILIVVVAATALLVLGATLVPLAIPGTRDINAYGTVTVHSLYGDASGGLGPAISSGDVLNAVDGLAVVWRPVPDYSGEPTCQLYSADGTWYEDGNWNLNTNTDPYFHLWGFTLEGVPRGTTEFYCAFGGMYTDEISWVGSTIHFNIESVVNPTYPPVEFTVEPAPDPVEGGELAALRWWFVYEGEATATVYVDDVEVSTRDITPSPTAQPFTYSFQEYTEGDYTVKLTITPEFGVSASSECQVTVTSTATTTTTPTTTTDTETTTTGTGTATTTEPDGEEAEFPVVWVVLGIIIFAALILKVAK